MKRYPGEGIWAVVPGADDDGAMVVGDSEPAPELNTGRLFASRPKPIRLVHKEEATVPKEKAAGLGGEKPLRLVAVLANSVKTIGLEKFQLKLRGEPTRASLTLCSINAMRIVLALLFRISANREEHFSVCLTSVSELTRLLGIDYRLSRKRVEELLTEVTGVRCITRRYGIFKVLPVMAFAEFDDETGAIRLKLSREMEPYLLGLERDFRKLGKCIFKLGTPRAVLLYLLFRSFVGLERKRHRVPIAELYRDMQIDKKTPWDMFRRKHLEPAIADINAVTELRVSRPEVERQGSTDRKRGEVTAVLFKVKSGNLIETPDKEEDATGTKPLFKLKLGKEQAFPRGNP